MSPSTWKRYFLPSFTFMSVVIGGGYATGRELVEFFMPAGPLGGLLGMGVTALAWSVVFAVSLELARASSSFDYRAFFSQILGRAWVLFDVLYIAILLLVLSVLGAASGELAHAALDVPLWCGTVALMVAIAALASFGSAAIETFFSIWGVVLYVTYAVFLLVSLTLFHEPIGAALSSRNAVMPGWLSGGLAYAGYNLAIVPALLFCARHQVRRRESLIAGALAGPIAILPGILFYIAMLARYPEIRAAPVPVQVLLAALEMPWLALTMQIILFGTLVKTGVGVVHGFNERLLAVWQTLLPRRIRTVRFVVPLAASVIAVVLAARVGLVDLIAKGYGHLAWIVIAIYIVPLLTVGIWRLSRLAPDSAPASACGSVRGVSP